MMLHVLDGELVLMLSSLYIRQVMHDCGQLGGWCRKTELPKANL